MDSTVFLKQLALSCHIVMVMLFHCIIKSTSFNKKVMRPSCLLIMQFRKHCFHNVTMLCIWFFLFSYMLGKCTLLDRLEMSQYIPDDGETLVSAGEITEMGFFSPGNSTRRYLGIWYKNVSPFTVVWVANQNTPLENNFGVLKLNEKGILELLNPTNNTIWSSSNNISSKARTNPIVRLLNSENLVKNGQGTKDDSFLWQSFDHPCDTYMPGMKVGWNLDTDLEWFLSSWKSVDDHAKGEYALKIDLRGYLQIIKFKGIVIITRAGSWNGLSAVGYPGPTLGISPIFVFNKKEMSYRYNSLDKSMFSVY